MKVLVVYASKTGFTKGIAESVGERLAKRGLQVDVREASGALSVGGYDAFVIGSAIYMFHWVKEAREFVSRNRTLLAARPVWLFSSGPVGTKTTDADGKDVREAAGPKELDELRESVRPRDYRVLFGGLDGSRLKGTMGLVYRMMSRNKAARESMPEGDFRDWKEIESWADGIADALGATPIPASAGS